MTKIKNFCEAYRAISQFHENKRIIAWVQTRWWTILLTPKIRRQVLFLGAIMAGVLGLLHRHAQWADYRAVTTWLAPLVVVPLIFGLVYLLYLAATRFSRLPAGIKRRPQTSLHVFFWATVVIIWVTPDDGGLWKEVITLMGVSLPYLLWRCGYMVISGQRGKVSGTGFRDHLFYLFPIWDGTNTPAGKGLDYLSECEARSPEAYARSLLAGLKLLLLALLWKLLLLLMGSLVYGNPKNPLTSLLGGYSLEIPRMKSIVNGTVTVSLLTTWVSLYFDLIWATLKLAARGHLWIGMLRLFGFNVFRNTYKPLLAESIVDFWNRYYYYFKELLVEFFFFPTYLRHFRKSPRLRMITAIFAAAFVGNMYYHLIQAKNPLVAGDLDRIWHILGPRFVYCFCLAVGVSVSMLRQQKQRGKPHAITPGVARFRRVRKITGVWTFFSLINFWNLKASVTMPEQAVFFLSLFGL